MKIKIVPSTFPEDLEKSKYTPVDYVIENSRLKANNVVEILKVRILFWELLYNNIKKKSLS